MNDRSSHAILLHLSITRSRWIRYILQITNCWTTMAGTVWSCLRRRNHYSDYETEGSLFFDFGFKGINRRKSALSYNPCYFNINLSIFDIDSSSLFKTALNATLNLWLAQPIKGISAWITNELLFKILSIMVQTMLSQMFWYFSCTNVRNSKYALA